MSATNIEYNLYQYLITEFSSYVFTVNGKGISTPDEVIEINGSGGVSGAWYDRNDYRIQLLIHAKSSVDANYKALTLFEKLEKRFGLTLPSITVNGTVYPAVKTYQILAIQTPGYIGVDDVGCEMFSFNITLTTK